MEIAVKIVVLGILAGGAAWAVAVQRKGDDAGQSPAPVVRPKRRKKVNLAAILAGVAAVVGLAKVGTGGGGQGSVGSVTPSPPTGSVVSAPAGSGGAQVLLDFIARGESGGNYNIVWGGISVADRPPKALVDMTVGEVLAWQDRIDPKYNSEAAGKYQILEDTLRGLGLPSNLRFDRGGQDRAAMVLLKRRGWAGFLSGSMSIERFALSLAKEWASLPVIAPVTGSRGFTLRAGQSYYAGDGLNAASASVNGFVAALKAARGY